MSKFYSNRWLTVRTGAKPALLLVSSVGLYLTAREVRAASAKHVGIPWKKLHKQGWRVVRVSVKEVEDGLSPPAPTGRPTARPRYGNASRHGTRPTTPY